MRLEYIDGGVLGLSILIISVAVVTKKNSNIGIILAITLSIFTNILVVYNFDKNAKTNIKLFKQGKTLVQYAQIRGQANYIISKEKGWRIKNDIYFTNDNFIIKASQCDLLDED